MTHSQKRGFTLLELLIVITILAILSLVVILFINPVEILKKSRDVQRMSDLSTMKTALALYLQDKPSNNLGGATLCGAGTLADGALTTTSASASIADSTPATGATFTTGGTTCATAGAYNATTSAEMFNNNGLGWIRGPSGNTFLAGVTGGAPIEKIPTDPVNSSVSTGTACTTGARDTLYYRYGCKTNNTFEVDATLESDTYGVGGTDSKGDKDGGNSSMRFEVGTDLNILPSTAPVNFAGL